MKRCTWCLGSELEMQYHDDEWGYYDPSDKRYFEFLVLESFQAGLSWKTILNKRAAMHKAYYGFDRFKISSASDDDIERWASNTDLIRSRMKINAMIQNANLFDDIVREHGSFDSYLRSFLSVIPVHHNFDMEDDVPSSDEVSTALSKDLKARGFKYVGPVIMYAFLQATGVYNDHVKGCIRY